MKAAFHTLGCKVNQYETEALCKQFRQRGYEVVPEDDLADVYVINTCTVTGLADRKSRQYIRRMKKKNPDSIIVVTGCYAQIAPEEVEAVSGVDIVSGTNEKNKIVDYVETFRQEHRPQVHVKGYEELAVYEETGLVTALENRTRAYIKVQEGCNRFCSYCVIPYARGKVRSRRPDDVIAEAKGLLENGVKEIVLTGINTALYGTEEGFDPGVGDAAEAAGQKQTRMGSSAGVPREPVQGIELILRALSTLPGEFRIRLSSLEPAVVDQAYVKRLLQYPKLCPHLHLSAQSGSSRVLREMNRPYTREDYLDIVKVLKAWDADYAVTTDLIAGFPGETEEDFADSIRLIEEAGFCKVHGFKYSKRPLTKAAAMEGHLPPPVIKKRSEALMEAGAAAAQRFFGQNRGKVRRMLVEEQTEDGLWYTGYTDNYIKVYVNCDAVTENQFYSVRLIENYRDGMKGEVVK